MSPLPAVASLGRSVNWSDVPSRHAAYLCKSSPTQQLGRMTRSDEVRCSEQARLSASAAS
jgi:hypothetical protein